MNYLLATVPKITGLKPAAEFLGLYSSFMESLLKGKY
jgi:hypothetical protein